MSKFERVLPNIILVGIGLWVCFVSFTQQPAAAFSFPRLISALFVIFSLLVLGQSLLKKDREETPIPASVWNNILPGLLVAALYVFWASKALGFYTAAAITMFTLIAIYDPRSRKDLKKWVKLLGITATFITVMYLMFATLLGVFTPREIWLR